jgi:hypothetical protein
MASDKVFEGRGRCFYFPILWIVQPQPCVQTGAFDAPLIDTLPVHQSRVSGADVTPLLYYIKRTRTSV